MYYYEFAKRYKMSNTLAIIILGQLDIEGNRPLKHWQDDLQFNALNVYQELKSLQDSETYCKELFHILYTMK